MRFFEEHGTKLLGGTTAFLGALATLISTGAFKELLEPAAIGWLNIFVSLATATVGGMTVARGFNNSTQVRVATAMETAIRSTPPAQGGFARPALLAILLAVSVPALLLSACQTPPSKVVQVACDPSAYTAERCAKGIAETWEVYHRRAEEIVTDIATPDEVKQPIQRAEAYTRPAIVEMLKSAAAYKRIKDEIAAGATDEEKLRIADARLEQWVRVALPRIDAMGNALGL